MKESPVSKSCRKLLEAYRIPHTRTNSGRILLGSPGRMRMIRLCAAGWPDITACLPPKGTFCGIEVKKPLGPRGGKNGSVQTDDQLECEKRIKSAGGEYIVVRSSQELELQLRNWGCIS